MVVGLRGGLAGDVGGSGDERMPEGADQLAAEFVLHDAYGDGAVFVDELLRQVVGGGVDESGGSRDVGEQVPRDQGNLLHIHRQSLHGIQKDNHALFLVALLDAVDAHQRLLAGGVAADTPHCISGIQNHFSIPQQ